MKRVLSFSGERLAAGPVHRLARVEAVGGHRLGAEVERDRHVRHVGARRRPARQRVVVRTRIVAHHALERLRQQRKAVHRRQRREDDMRDADRTEQPVGERGALLDRAPRRHEVDHVVDTGDDDCDLAGDGTGARRVAHPLEQQRVHLARGQAALRVQLPVHRPPREAVQRAAEVAGERAVLVVDADAGSRRIAGDQHAQRFAVAR